MEVRKVEPSARSAANASPDRADWAPGAPGPGDAVWRVDLALSEVERHACRTRLTDAERARADRYLRREDADRFAAARAALRLILAGALDADPAALTFRAGAGGKPALDGPWREQLAFNLSHSGQIALMALSRAARVGVDVEALRPIADPLRLARGQFAPGETAALAGLAEGERLEAFYACWTAKEAFVKAVGLGLSMPLDRFRVAVPPAPAALLEIAGDPGPAAAWNLRRLEPAPGYIGAVAVEDPRAALALRSLPPGWVKA